MEDLVGITLGGYTLLRPLGNGGMGSVYLAQDTTIGQSVAVKVIQQDPAMPVASQSMTYGQVEDRFRQEARAVASLDHLHILPLYRYGEEETRVGKRAYMVMQYRPEGSLGDWFKARASGVLGHSEAISIHTSTNFANLPTQWPLSLHETAVYVQQAASALQHAHDHGLVHRDVKPANFLLRFDHDVPEQRTEAFLLLSDFGLVKSLSSQVTPSSILGTPMYMAPEQFSGRAGPASDQYALAVMTYVMLTGHHPFSGETMQLMHQHLTVVPPSPRRYCPTLPLVTEKVVLRALAKEPQQRYASIAAFSEAFVASLSVTSRRTFSLMNLFSTRHERARSASKPRSVGVDLLAQEEATVIRTSTEKAALPLVMEAMRSGPMETPLASKQRVLQDEQAELPAIHAVAEEGQDLTVPVAQPMTEEDQDLTVAVADAASSSPLSTQPLPAERVNSVNRRSVLAWIAGGVVVAGASIATGALLYHNVSHAQVASSAGSPVRTTLVGHQAAISALAWSSDGTQLASGSKDRTIRVWPTSNLHSPLVIDPQILAVTAMAWKPQQSQLAASGMAGEIVLLDVSVSSGQVTNEQTFPLAGSISSLAWDRAGSAIFAGTLRAGLYTLTPASGQVQQVGGAKAAIRAMTLAPNGQMLAFGTNAGTVAVLDLGTQKWSFRERLHTGAVSALAWSSDGTRLASGGPDQLLQIVDARSWQLQATSQQASAINGIGWKPGVSSLLVSALADGTICLYTVASSTVQTYRGHSGAVTALAWSAGGLATGSSDKSVIIWDL